MKTINTIDDAIKVLREPIPYMEPDEDLMKIAELLEELKVYKRALELTAEDYILGIRIRAKSANEYIEHYLYQGKVKERERNRNDK